MRSFHLAVTLAATTCGCSCLGFVPSGRLLRRVRSSSQHYASIPKAGRRSNNTTLEETSSPLEQLLESSVTEETKLGVELDKATDSLPLQLITQEPFETGEVKPCVVKNTVETSSLSSLRQAIDDVKQSAAMEGVNNGALTEAPERAPLEKAGTSISLVAFLGAGTYLFSAVFGDLLGRFELVQDWRYAWPLVGFLYAADGARALLSTEGMGVLEGWWGIRSKNAAARILQVLGGLSLIVGGAYDAFMPVWMTGPNVVTNAGIGQDGAALLFLWTAWYTYQNLQQQCTSNYKEKNDAIDAVFESLRHGPLLSQIILLAQLYKLSESSFDELIF